ncbi:hypothetical protein GCM10009122_05730 [Fulvivirga kasyanovii]|uniref:T9SS type A sorting domain-containing protein n=1 Tax=Fulvivirga kasyanovii TaxID=396812 RepID=A0ABW9RTK4_9BACT|nr:GEVED domain-containing protein [Fulvivirga kasyanovii]MTI27041.1 T9SS type A sorting domain-containing protein [Fulvivirga kasyanovii]
MKKNYYFTLRKYVLLMILLMGAVSMNYAQTKKPWDVLREGGTYEEIKRATDAYYETHDTGRGSGYKQMQRILYFMKRRSRPDGTIISQDESWKKYAAFKAKAAATSRTNAVNDWSPLGPGRLEQVTTSWAPGVGRIQAFARLENDPNLMYVGSPSGGAWKSTDGGNSWIPIADDLAAIGVSDIVIDYTNPNTVYITTGDPDSWDTYSIGVMKSTDGGATWQSTGLQHDVSQSKALGRIIMHPSNPNILLVAGSDGIYKTTDAGANWAKIYNQRVYDIEFKPGDPNIVYATGPNFLKSTNGGNSFSVVTSGLPSSFSSSYRAFLAVSPSAPGYVYIVYGIGAGAIYRSTDSGNSFTTRKSSGNGYNLMGYTPNDNSSQSWYDLDIAVSPTNYNEVHVGGVVTYRSLDGGANWTQTSKWTHVTGPDGVPAVHPDIHVMEYVGNTLYIGNDGYLVETTDRGDSWLNLSNGIATRQFYGIGVSRLDHTMVAGGAQDNGTSVYKNSTWYEWLGADGGEAIVDKDNTNVVYGTTQNGGSWYKSTSGGENSISLNGPGTGAWVVPYAQAQDVSGTFYVGLSGGTIKKSSNSMQSWQNAGRAGNATIESIAIAPSNSNYIYAASENGIYRTTNGGSGNWTNITNGLPAIVNYISVHPDDPQKVAVAIRGYSGQKIYISTNAGNSWTNISGTLPDMSANCVVWHKNSANGIYAGMDVGVYYKDDNTGGWILYSQSLPNVIVNELEIHETAGKIYAGTYGRGLWVADIYSGGGATAPVAAFAADQTVITEGGSISFTDQSTNSPTQWSWSFPGGTPATSTEQNPVVTYAIAGIYDVTLTVTNSAGNDTETKTGYITVEDPGIAYCASTSSNSSYEHLANVTVGSFSNPSGATNYSDFTSLVIPLAQGGNSIALTPGFSGQTYQEYFRVWVDFNQDGDFDDANELAFDSGGSSQTVQGTLTVPSGALQGATRLRVSMKYSGVPTACESFQYGEVEDYTANIGSGATLPAPSNMSAQAVSSSQIDLSWSDNSADEEAFEIQRSDNGGSYVSITEVGEGVTSYSDQNLQAATSYSYRVRARKQSSYSSYSNSASATTHQAVSYCAVTNGNPSGQYVRRVRFGSIDNTTTYEADGYSDYTSISATVVQGGSETLVVTPQYTWAGSRAKAWIDWNKDGDFNDAGEEVLSGVGASASYSSTVSIPSGTSGVYRLRVRTTYGETPTPCNDQYHSEMEDYTINVSPSAVAPHRQEEVTAEIRQLVVYPNPTQKTIYIRLTGAQMENAKVSVLNVAGKIVYESNYAGEPIHLDRLVKGVYIVKLMVNDSSYEQKIILE